MKLSVVATFLKRCIARRERRSVYPFWYGCYSIVRPDVENTNVQKYKFHVWPFGNDEFWFYPQMQGSCFCHVWTMLNLSTHADAKTLWLYWNICDLSIVLRLYHDVSIVITLHHNKIASWFKYRELRIVKRSGYAISIVITQYHNIASWLKYHDLSIVKSLYCDISIVITLYPYNIASWLKYLEKIALWTKYRDITIYIATYHDNIASWLTYHENIVTWVLIGNLKSSDLLIKYALTPDLNQKQDKRVKS